MQTIIARNVGQVLPELLTLLQQQGLKTTSQSNRISITDPLCVMFTHPNEVVSFWDHDDVDPTLGLLAGIWMLSGKSSGFLQKSFPYEIRERLLVNGFSVRSAYSQRLRSGFDMDQLKTLVAMLTSRVDDDRYTRRGVLNLYSPRQDGGLMVPEADIPGVTHVHVWIDAANGLNMHVVARESHVMHGVGGWEAVGWAIVQQYIAASTGASTGCLWYSVGCLYIPEGESREAFKLAPYADHQGTEDEFGKPITIPGYQAVCPYEQVPDCRPYPLFTDDPHSIGQWDADMDMVTDGEIFAIGYNTPFFRRVVIPALRAYREWTSADNPNKQERAQKALEIVQRMKPSDWSLGLLHWYSRKAGK